MAKNELAKAKTMRNRVHANQAAQQATHIPRLEAPFPRVETPHPRVTKVASSRGAPHPGGDRHPKQRKTQDNKYNHPTSTTTNCTGPSIKIQVTALRIPTQLHLSGQRQQPSPHETNHQIDSQKYHARSHAVMCGHIQAKLVSADLGILNYTKTPKPTGTIFTVTPKQMSQCKLPMKWLCKMANSVVEADGEFLKYRHLIANQITRATWQHSYGNKIRCLAQGMPG